MTQTEMLAGPLSAALEAIVDAVECPAGTSVDPDVMATYAGDGEAHIHAEALAGVLERAAARLRELSAVLALASDAAKGGEDGLRQTEGSGGGRGGHGYG